MLQTKISVLPKIPAVPFDIQRWLLQLWTAAPHKSTQHLALAQAAYTGWGASQLIASQASASGASVVAPVREQMETEGSEPSLALLKPKDSFRQLHLTCLPFSIWNLLTSFMFAAWTRIISSLMRTVWFSFVPIWFMLFLYSVKPISCPHLYPLEDSGEERSQWGGEPSLIVPETRVFQKSQFRSLGWNWEII